jgi:enoyl-CoA hydratase/carnithine racemase
VSEAEKRAVPPFTSLLYEVDGRVATITLNRPEKKNALTSALVNEVIVALETARDDPGVGAVVLTGAGGVFCSGADLSQMSGGGSEGGPIPFRGGFVELNLAFARIGKPVIAKVRRFALAGGLGLVCACQFALAEETATFATPEIDRGLFPMMIMANIFRTVPRRKGLELILLGEKVSAKDAEAIGLINRAVPADRLDEEVRALANKLASKPATIMRLGLEAFTKQADMALEEALPYLGEALLQCMSTDDAREGLMAFIEKREPKWNYS